MTLRSLLAVAVLLTLPGQGVLRAQSAEQAKPSPLTLGVMRGDGILIPFAAFDGDDWSTPWPSAIGGGRMGGPSALPANLDAVPADWWGSDIPSEWRLWPRDGKAALIIRPIAPALTFVGTSRRLGLRTDYRAAFNPFISPFEMPYPKEGLAVGGVATVEPIPVVSRLAPGFQKLGERLRSEIDAAEERTIRALRSRAGWTHPFDKAARAKVAPQMEAWYTSALVQPGSVASYIEAVKKYPPLPEDKGCGLESVVTGWVHHKEGEERLKPQLKVVVTYCDRENVSYMLPFGQIRLRDRTHWVFQMSGQDHEWYAVAELTPGRTRVRAEYYAGELPRSLLR